jgi:hypothetical protein
MPSFCATGPIDPQTATISVLVLTSGESAAALVSNQPLAAVLATFGATLAGCE